MAFKAEPRWITFVVAAWALIQLDVNAQVDDGDDTVYFEDLQRRFSLQGQPSIIVHYGFADAKGRDLSRNFRRLGHLDLQLGYKKSEPWIRQYIVDYSWRGAYVSHSADALWNKGSGSTEINTRAWQFGFGFEDGYGYAFGKSSIVPYRSSRFGWTRFDSDFSGGSSNDSAVLNLYDGVFRFGQTGGTRIQFEFFPSVGFDVGFERGVVFPRHLFWKHLGSVVVEEASHALLNWFTTKILESSPAAGPVVSFLLRSGLTFASYELRKENMNWPFASSSPVAYDVASIGVRFNF